MSIYAGKSDSNNRTHQGRDAVTAYIDNIAARHPDFFPLSSLLNPPKPEFSESETPRCNSTKLYHFNLEHAVKFGVCEAILIANFQFWIRKNKAKKKNFHDGRWWTFNSIEKLSLIFPFWTSNQIERILKSLIKKGVLIAGNYNQIKYDRTKWYAFKDESLFIDISENAEMEFRKNGTGIPQKREPIPYSKQYNKTTTGTDKKAVVETNDLKDKDNGKGNGSPLMKDLFNPALSAKDKGGSLTQQEQIMQIRRWLSKTPFSVVTDETLLMLLKEKGVEHVALVAEDLGTSHRGGGANIPKPDGYFIGTCRKYVRPAGFITQAERSGKERREQAQLQKQFEEERAERENLIKEGIPQEAQDFIDKLRSGDKKERAGNAKTCQKEHLGCFSMRFCPATRESEKWCKEQNSWCRK